jgi:hypothetical protein
MQVRVHKTEGGVMGRRMGLLMLGMGGAAALYPRLVPSPALHFGPDQPRPCKLIVISRL